jgi:hypothetical protein
VRKSDLPFGSEFSPDQVSLPTLLEFAAKHAGNSRAFEDEVRQTYFSDVPERSDYNNRKLANNTKLSMQAYGLVDTDVHLTRTGTELYDLRDSPDALYRAFAKHILSNLYGLALIQCVEEMVGAGERVTLISLRVQMEARGVHFPRGGKHPSIMRLWLEKAGVFTSGWRVNQARYEEILGLGAEEIAALTALTPQQRAYLRTLANVAPHTPLLSNEVERLATVTYGVQFDEKNLPKSVLYPLRDAGFITAERSQKVVGRGGKPFLVAVTDRFQTDVLQPILKQADQQVLLELRPLLRMPLADIISELDHESTYARGLALEALSLKLMRLVDLEYRGTRVRGDATGGAEVDLVFESARLVFSRWQVQCKNTAQVRLDDVAKEVGLTHLLKSNVVVIISTGRVGPEARRYATTIMRDCNLCIVMIDREDLDGIVSNPTKIAEVLSREARYAMEIKHIKFTEI